MVNNAGASFVAKPENISANGWNAVVSINLNGASSAASGRASRYNNGPEDGRVIINISSLAGVRGAATVSHYGAAKAAVINYTRSLEMAWGRKGVRVVCVAPGPIDTDRAVTLEVDRGPAFTEGE